MARSKWTLSIAGIVNIMVKTVNAVKEMDPMTAQYHNETVGDGKDAHVCGGRTGRTAFCKKCGKKELTGDMISTGGILSKKQEEPVQFTEAERAGMLPKDIPLETLQVVNFIEPLPYWYLKGDHQFVIAQNAPSLGSLAMLYDALARTKKVALIRSWDSGNEYYSVLTHEGIMTSCYFGAEITKANEELDKVKAATVDAKVSTLMTQLVKKNIKADFKVDTLHNTFK